MMKIEIPDSLFRAGGVAAIFAGLLMISGFALHPAGEDATFGTDPFWVPAHALIWAGYMLALVAWIAIYLAQSRETGNFGVVALVIAVVGTSFATWIFSSDVTFVPVIAAVAPALFRRIFSSAHLVLGIASVLMWVAGNVLFGIAIIKAKVFPRWAGVLLIAGTATIPIAYLAQLSERIIAVGGGVTGASVAWVGYELLRLTR